AAQLSVPAAGLLLAAQPAGAMIAAPIAGRLAARLSPRLLLQAGSLIAAAGLAWIGFAGRQAQIAPLALSMFANGLGVGLFQVAYFDIVTAALPRADRGVAGSLAMATRTIGVVAGATLLMLTFQSLDAAAASAGAAPEDAFLAGIRGVFRIAAAVPLLPLLLGGALSLSRRVRGC
ncbi:MAG: MFS transporter, partial [Proteobacteria bacterium]|nr:MFS transporter [Pseudomonadota bacterium]